MSDSSRPTNTVTLTDMGEPADLANGLAVLRHIAEHGESFVRSCEAAALLAEIGRLREIESCGDLLRLAPEPAARLEYQPGSLTEEEIAGGADIPNCLRCGRTLFGGHSHDSRWYCSSETKAGSES